MIFGVSIMRDFSKKYILTSIDDIKTAAEGVLHGLDEGFSISDEKRYEITLVINELLVNSFQHAQPSGDAPVVFDAHTHSGQLDMRVKDSGQGFAFQCRVSQIEDRDEKPHLFRERGRGLMLVEAFCQEMHYNGKGNSVEVRIAL